VSQRVWIILSVVVDALVLNAAILLAFVIRFGWPLPAFNLEAYTTIVIPLTAGQLLVFFLVDLYDPSAERSGPQLFNTVAKGVLIGLAVLAGLSFLLRAFSFPRTVIVIAFFCELLAVWGWRRAAAGILRVRWPERQVVVIGDPSDVAPVLERLEGVRRWGYRVTAVLVGEGATEGTAFAGYRLLDSVDELPAFLESEPPDQVIVATPSRHRGVLERIALSRRFSGEILVAPELYEMHLGEIDFELLGDLPLLCLTTGAPSTWRVAVLNLLERLAALVMLVVLSPVYLVIALLVAATSGFPILYRQVRSGREQSPFKLYKFRTMVTSAEDEGPVLAEPRDPRVTGIGRLLRVSRMDELPQFWNVLRGDMSFVGPRPERPEFVDDFIAEDPLYAERFQVRPGITGLAQVSGSYATEASVKLRFDLMYIYHRSLGLDLKIILRTIKVVLVGKGAV
jgi:exopolysaccharide biosynthesis polyprenyl glycosylphosphotransferase